MGRRAAQHFFRTLRAWTPAVSCAASSWWVRQDRGRPPPRERSPGGCGATARRARRSALGTRLDPRRQRHAAQPASRPRSPVTRGSSTGTTSPSVRPTSCGRAPTRSCSSICPGARSCGGCSPARSGGPRLRTELWAGNRESIRLAVLLPRLLLWFTWTEYPKYPNRYRALASDPLWSHIQWIRLPSGRAARAWLQTLEVIRRQDRDEPPER